MSGRWVKIVQAPSRPIKTLMLVHLLPPKTPRQYLPRLINLLLPLHLDPHRLLLSHLAYTLLLRLSSTLRQSMPLFPLASFLFGTFVSRLDFRRSTCLFLALPGQYSLSFALLRFFLGPLPRRLAFASFVLQPCPFGTLGRRLGLDEALGLLFLLSLLGKDSFTLNSLLFQSLHLDPLRRLGACLLFGCQCCLFDSFLLHLG
mmetsp:Transcript_35366/g.57669  ORF Transcript_35366/g.57669 Transcript_35366/m.57669 type:complete len:202 (-) Transcript_35366:348-953(-)